MRRGHYYITLELADGTIEEYAIPARHGSLAAIDIVKNAISGSKVRDITWRADFRDRHLPGNCQATYSQTNTEMCPPRLFRTPVQNGEPITARDWAPQLVA